jgi:hypothetical protein
MRFRWSALAVVLILVFMPRVGAAQSTGQRKDPAVKLGQNYPNPFNPETWIPFTIGDVPACAEGNRQYKVSVRIYNILMQPVATPIIQGGAGSVAGGQPFENLMLTCGQYVAYWDGFYAGTKKEAASGVYIYIIEVDGKRFTKKMISMK